MEHRPERAAHILNQAVGHNPKEQSLYFAQADLLWAQHRASEVEGIFKALQREQGDSAGTLLLIGDFYLSHHDVGHACEQYLRAKQTALKDLRAQRRIFDCYLARNQLDEADALNHELRRTNPTDSEVVLGRARILMAQHRPAEAAAELRDQLGRTKDLPRVHHLLGLAYWDAGQLQQAKIELKDAIRLAPDSAKIRRDFAKILIALHELSNAQEQAEALLQDDVANLDAHLLLGRILLLRGKCVQARERFLAAKQIGPIDPAALVGLGQAYAGEGRLVEAEREFEGALAHNPRDTEALGSLAQVMMESHDQSRAIARLQLYVARFPQDAKAHVLLARAYLKGNQSRAAGREFELAHQADPGLPRPYIEQGKLHERSGNVEGAIQEYTAASTLQPKTASVPTRLGNLYMAKKDWAAARKQYEAALVADPDYAVAAGNLAWLDIQQGRNLDEALNLAARAKRGAPENIPITDTLGWVYYERGVYGLAVPLLEECVQKAPNSPVYRFHLGMAQFARGEKYKAKRELDFALRLKLAGDDAEIARAALRGLE